MPYITRVKRVDVIWDVYRQDSQKATTREEWSWSYYTYISPNSTKIENGNRISPLSGKTSGVVSHERKGWSWKNNSAMRQWIHEIATHLGPQKAKALPMLHALTGCDKGSFFSGRGKRTTWNVFGQITNVLSSIPETIPEEYTWLIESFVITSLQQNKCS